MSSRWKERRAKTRKDMKKKIQSEEGALAWDRQLCLTQWQRTRRGLWQLPEVQRGGMGNMKTNETPQGTWLSGTW